MFDAGNIQIQRLSSRLWKKVHCDVLRLDRLHPVVSGNKWFKLKYYLQEAKSINKATIATFGGSHSNHIVATAFACRQAGLRSVGIIRGEKPPQLSPSLMDAETYGMELVYVDRGTYRNKTDIIRHYDSQDWFWVDEGGYGLTGMKGASEILQIPAMKSYSHIACACGTGTTLAGLVTAALPGQTCIGISALKGHVNLKEDVVELLRDPHQQKRFDVFLEYHFGGYARHPQNLLAWMNELWREEQLPTDIVYTAKLLFAIRDLIEKKYLKTGDKVLIVHSGGLQGNRSLAPGTLAFL